MGVLFLRYEGVLTPLQTMLLEKIKFELKYIQHFRHQSFNLNGQTLEFDDLRYDLLELVK